MGYEMSIVALSSFHSASCEKLRKGPFVIIGSFLMQTCRLKRIFPPSLNGRSLSSLESSRKLTTPSSKL